MLIEAAVLVDVPQLCELLALLFAQEVDFAPDAARQSAGLRAIIENPEVGQILVWKSAERVLGMVSLLWTISTALGGRVAILEDMIVHPTQRGHGVGEALLEAATLAARAADCLRITLLTDGQNQGAQRFYARSGFQISEMKAMRLRLE